MELYIRMANGQPVDHPIMGDNFRDAFPDIDTNNLPSDFAPFIRVPQPVKGVYQVASVTYGWILGTVQDIWTLRDMTAEEKDAKIAAAMADEHPTNWVFDEPTCSWVAPTA